MRRGTVLVVTSVAAVGWMLARPASVRAQDPPAAVDTVPAASADTSTSVAERLAPTPAGAFTRSLLVPGWGQAANGAYLRGGVYFAAQTGSWFMLLKTIAKLGEARDLERRRTAMAADSLRAVDELYDDPEALETALEDVPNVVSARELVASREEQREDWIAWTIFWTLASAVDAFVTAHLSDFPDWFAAEPGRDGAAVLRVTLPAGRAP